MTEKRWRSLAFADDEREAAIKADGLWRQGRRVMVVQVSHAREIIGRDIRTVHRFAVVEEEAEAK